MGQICGALERDESFAELQSQFPLQARMLLAFFRHSEAALEAVGKFGDLPSAQRSVLAMGELFSWINGVSAPQIDKQMSRSFGELLRAGVSIEQAAIVLRHPTKLRRGRPVSNRLPVLLAVEEQLRNPKMSYMQLVMKFCPCSERIHDHDCRERLRQQIMVLKTTLRELGV